MPRGRPTQSDIRKNLIEILAVKGTDYGYALHKYYSKIFGPCTREVVYYHLRKGVSLGEFELAEVRREEGDYSWGRIVEKKYYKLGPNAKPKGDPRVKEFFEKEGGVPPATEKKPAEEAKEGATPEEGAPAEAATPPEKKG